MYLFWLFLLLFRADVHVANADSSIDRCAVAHCTCEVRRGPAPTITANSVQIRRQHTIYFREDESEITSSQDTSLSSFIERIRRTDQRSITLIGYTDGCGGEAYNRRLAAQRVQQVKRAIEQDIPNARFNTIIHGEKTGDHSPNARIVEVVVHSDNSFTTRIERIPADVYLIDASGSMWDGWRNWTDVINASLKPNSTIYVSMMNGCYNGQRLNSISPRSGTEIWYSYYYVLTQMQPNQTLLIISDFDSNVPLSPNERQIITNLARRKNITVRTLR